MLEAGAMRTAKTIAAIFVLLARSALCQLQAVEPGTVLPSRHLGDRFHYHPDRRSNHHLSDFSLRQGADRFLEGCAGRTDLQSLQRAIPNPAIKFASTFTANSTARISTPTSSLKWSRPFPTTVTASPWTARPQPIPCTRACNRSRPPFSSTQPRTAPANANRSHYTWLNNPARGSSGFNRANSRRISFDRSSCTFGTAICTSTI